MPISRKKTTLTVTSIYINLLLVGLLISLEVTLQLSDRMFSRLGIKTFWNINYTHAALDYHLITSKELTVHGIINYQKNSKNLGRLDHIEHGLRSELKRLGKHASGVRVRFKTDSKLLHISMSKLTPLGYSYPYISEQAASSVDVYIDNKYVQTITNRNLDEISVITHPDATNEMRIVELYLPNFSPIDLHAVGLLKGSRVEYAPPYNTSLVFYGTSITQGASSPRSGLTYPAILARELNVDFYNYGFLGNGFGESEMASILSMSSADIYILEYSRQASDEIVSITDNLIRFCSTIKQRNLEAKIIILTALFDIEEGLGNNRFENRRIAFRQAFSELKSKYTGISLVEGFDYIGPDDRHLLTDGTHPNAEGMSIIANKLADIIKPLLH